MAAASVSSVMKSLHGVWQAMQADDAIKASIHDMSARLNTKPALQVVDSLVRLSMLNVCGSRHVPFADP